MRQIISTQVKVKFFKNILSILLHLPFQYIQEFFFLSKGGLQEVGSFLLLFWILLLRT
jgi:hypothetical protein